MSAARGGDRAAVSNPKGHMMKKHFLPLAAAAMAMGTTASADPFVDAVVKNFQDMGYEFVEIERGRTQLKAEGVRGTQELEVIYDLATGRIISRETGRADDDYIGRSGVEIGTRDRDFVGDDNDDDDSDDSDDDNDDDDLDDNDDDDRSGSRDDNDDDNDDDDSSGSRDDDDDDDSSGSGSGSDDNDDDNDDDDSGSDNDDSSSDDSGSDDNDDDNDDDD
jgi:hypothetical protein